MGDFQLTDEGWHRQQTASGATPGRVGEGFRIATVIALICGLVAASFFMGLGRRMNHKIGWGPLDDIWHLSVAISKDAYGLQGYVGFYKVFLTLQQSLGITDWNVGPNQPDMPSMSNGALLDAAIRKAASFDELRAVGPTFPRTLQAYAAGVGIVGTNLMSPIAEDLGESDLYALAFRLFGFRIESAYYLFFSLFAVSIVAFVLQFHRNMMALAVLLFNVFAFHIFFYIPFFSVFMPTVYINRFASTLCIIPASHFLFLLLARQRLSLPAVMLAVVQLCILLLGAFIRSTGNWTVLAAVLLFLVLVAAAVARLRRQAQPVRLRSAIKTLRTWPLLLLLGGVGGLALYVNTVPNPMYRTGDINQPHHMLWHSLWIGLSFHPDWPKYFPDLPVNSDSTAGILATRIWVERGHTLADLNSPYTNAMRVGAYEAIVREQYLKFVRAHPVYLLQTVFYYKPKLFINLIENLFTPIDRGVVVPLVATLLAAAMLGAGVCMLSAAGIFALLLICSLVPVMLTYPAEHVISDQVWTFTGLALAVSAAVSCGAVRLLRMAAQKAGVPSRAARFVGGLDRAAAVAVPVGTGVAILVLVGILIALAVAPSINVLDAVYADCAVPKDQGPAATDYYNGKITYTYFAGTECDGRWRCSFHANEPSPGQTDNAADLCKDRLKISWQCGSDGPTNETKIVLDANRQYHALLSCH